MDYKNVWRKMQGFVKITKSKSWWMSLEMVAQWFGHLVNLFVLTKQCLDVRVHMPIFTNPCQVSPRNETLRYMGLLMLCQCFWNFENLFKENKH
jgi:hypothetical protein